MNETVSVMIVLGALGLLVGAAAILQRRSKEKGDLLTGERHEPQPGARGRFYVSLLVTLGAAVLGVWGFLSDSIPLMIIAGMIFALSVGFQYYWRIRSLLGNGKQGEQPE